MIIFPHIVKTGGSTIAEHIRENIGTGYAENRRVPYSGLRFLQGHSVRYGDHIHLKTNPNYMTVIRDPADWLVSVYNHDRSRKDNRKTFEQWYMDGDGNRITPYWFPDNNMSQHFIVATCAKYRGLIEHTFEELIKVLESFPFIGITEDIDYWFPLLCEYMYIPKTFKHRRVSGKFDPIDNKLIKKFYTLSERMRERIYKENPYDLKLYAWAKRRYEAHKKQGIDFKGVFDESN